MTDAFDRRRFVTTLAVAAGGLYTGPLQAQAATETTHDVNPAAVDDLMARLDTGLLIHGHTHQPMLHCWTTQAARDRAEPRVRWVLSDWSASPPRGGVLSLGAGVIRPAC